MRSAPWHVKGVPPSTRETAHRAARRSGLSVGEWLHETIRGAAEPSGEDLPAVTTPGSECGPSPVPMTARFDERLDVLTQQIDRLVNATVRAQDSVPQRMAEAISRLDQRLDQLIRQGRSTADEMERRTDSVERALASLGREKLRAAFVPAAPPDETMGDAMAQIAARQRQLDGQRPGPEAYAPSRRPAVAEPAAPDLSGLEAQIRSLTSRIETLNRPCALDEAVKALRQQLTEISGALREAMPRRAVEALEGEIRKLADQIASGREAGLGPAALSGLERGLTEVREALRGLAPAESLVGFEEAIQTLSRKVDLLSIGSRDGANPATLQQIESAVETLRGVAGHVASGEALALLATEVRALGEKIDRVTSRPADDLLKTLDLRINAIAEAIETLRRDGSPAVPAGFEELIRSLNDKIERLQLSRTDHTAIGALEERIARLVEKLDASEARLGHLGAIERGMAELLVHLEAMRAVQGGVPVKTADAPPVVAVAPAPPTVDLLRRDVADIKETQTVAGRRTEDSLEAVHGTIGDVVNRLAMIESDMRIETRPAPDSAVPDAAEPAEEQDGLPDPIASLRPAEQPPAGAALTRSKPATGPARQPIDPSLPPDYPLEPGSGAPRTRPGATPSERIVAADKSLRSNRGEASAEGDGEAPNFLEAARRAAKAAALQQSSADTAAGETPPGSPLSDRLKQLFVGVGVLVAVASAFRFAGVYLDPERVILADAPSTRNEMVQLPADLPATARAIAVPGLAELVPPSTRTVPGVEPPGLAPTTGDRAFATAPPSGAIVPDRQASAPVARSDITGSLASRPESATKHVSAAPASSPSALPPAKASSEPVATASIPAAPAASPAMASVPSPGPAAVQSAPNPAPAETASAEPIGKGLLAAASAGNPAAAHEMASRYAEGRGVAQSYKDAAVWYERAAKSGLAPAQFRLGTMYEKGLGVPKDLKEARRLYLAAAEQQNAKAMHNIAVLYAEGIEGKPDYRTAAQWFQKAAEYGVVDSQYNLAVLYARGIGVEQDLTQSYKWFSLAAAGGDKDAAKKRDDVAGRLDQRQLARAREALGGFAAKQQPEAAATVKMPPDGWDRAAAPVAAPVKSKEKAHRPAKTASVVR